MPVRDKFHTAVVKALNKLGWTITEDPSRQADETREVQIDLKAELPASEEQEARTILVEIKTFAEQSKISALHDALGHYLVYRNILESAQNEKPPYLAIPKDAADGIFAEPIGRRLVQEYRIALIVYDPAQRR